MTWEIVYCGVGNVSTLTRYDTPEGSRDTHPDVPQTVPPGEQSVPAGAGEEETGGAAMEQPQASEASPQENTGQTEPVAEEREPVQEELPQAAPQEPAATGSSSPERDDGQEKQESLPGDEQLPEERTGVPQEETAVEKEGQLLFQGTPAVTPPAVSSDAGALLPFAAGVLVALGVTALLLWLRHRYPRERVGRAYNGHGLRTASLHELGDRTDQQDAFCLAGLEAPEGGVLAAVADGMGGLVDSGQVSRALTHALSGSFAPGRETPPARQLQLLLRQALEQVETLRKGQTAQSGSTLVMGLIREGGLSWMSVGDSRIYLWRGGGMIQLNRDHDFSHDLTLLALQGDMTLAEADQDPRRENLTSFIGRGFPRKVEWNPEPVTLLPGDKVVLMSDGVYRALSQQEMAQCLRGDVSKAARTLREAVTEKGLPQQDNFTAVILEKM